MHWIVVHHHWRPGGVRRVIEMALPHLLRGSGKGPHQVTLASGEAADDAWRRTLRDALPDARLEFVVESAFHYIAEQRRSISEIRRRLPVAISRLLAAGSISATVVWAHNLGLGRNLLLAEALVEVCARHGVPLLEHHHDWWFDNRWNRWAELRAAGFRTLQATADTLFSRQPVVRHATINAADAQVLGRHLKRRSGWLPNLVERPARHVAATRRRARQWLANVLGDNGPVWLLPCRLLRRKNIAEAVLLTRWLNPNAWLVTTGGPSSPEEQPYHARLRSASVQGKWRVRLGLLASRKAGDAPSVPELMAASDAVLLTSIQEGFGLPYLEAAAARRPLIGRVLPNVAPDLKRFGFRFPQSYRDLQVPLALFNVRAERDRQARLFRSWKSALPRRCQRWVEAPDLLSAVASRADRVAFSRLTLSAQLEVLAHPPAESWKACASLNPFLREWRRRTQQGELQVTPWSRTAEGWLGGTAYARRLLSLVRRPPGPTPGEESPTAIQEELIRAHLSREFLYPLLWSSDS